MSYGNPALPNLFTSWEIYAPLREVPQARREPQLSLGCDVTHITAHTSGFVRKEALEAYVSLSTKQMATPPHCVDVHGLTT